MISPRISQEKVVLDHLSKENLNPREKSPN